MIKLVERYSISTFGGMYMEKSDTGTYVLFDEYEKLAAAYAELQERYDLDVNPEGK